MISRFNRLAPLVIVIFWLLVMTALYFGLNHFMKPTPQVVTSTGDVVITRSRDGHFYVDGSVNGAQTRFLVDTGASLVVVSEPFAKSVGLTSGESMTFHTANGSLAGYVVPSADVTVGSLHISGLRLGVGLTVDNPSEIPIALLGQNFLSKFDVAISQHHMTLHKR